MDDNFLLVLIPSILKTIVTIVKMLLRHAEVMKGKRDADRIDYELEEDDLPVQQEGK